MTSILTRATSEAGLHELRRPRHNAMRAIIYREFLLLTRNRTALVSCSRCVTTGAPASRCSKLSKTIRRRFSRSWLTRCSINGRSLASCRPRLCAIVDGTSCGSRTGASETKNTPSGYFAATCEASAMHSRVLPLPPGPVSVTS